MMGKNGTRVLDKEYEYRDGKVIKIQNDDDDMIVIKDEPQD